jgi:hypothetical protein
MKKFLLILVALGLTGAIVYVLRARANSDGLPDPESDLSKSASELAQSDAELAANVAN